jgi:hypothetical protein
MNAPTEVFQMAVDGIARRDWRAVAALCDPASLAIFKRQLLNRVSATRKDAPLTAEQLMRIHPDMPREAADYQVSMHAKFADPQSILEDEVPGVAGLPALNAMAPVDIFAAHLASYGLDHQVEHARRYTAIPAEVIDHVRRHPPPTPSYVILGVIEDGERLAYVAYRRQFDDGPSSDQEGQADWSWAGYTAAEKQLSIALSRGQPELVTCRRQQDGSWRLIARHGFLGQGSFAFSFGEDGDAT